MRSFRFYIALLLILFSVNSIAESGASTDDIHDKRVAQLDSMRKSAITVDCSYIPPASQYESGPIEDRTSESKLPKYRSESEYTEDCSISQRINSLYKLCLASNARIIARNSEKDAQERADDAQERAKAVAVQTEENTKRVNANRLWLRTRVITKTIPVWSKCPESVEVGYNKYTDIWKILE